MGKNAKPTEKAKHEGFSHVVTVAVVDHVVFSCALVPLNFAPLAGPVALLPTYRQCSQESNDPSEEDLKRQQMLCLD